MKTDTHLMSVFFVPTIYGSHETRYDITISSDGTTVAINKGKMTTTLYNKNGHLMPENFIATSEKSAAMKNNPPLAASEYYLFNDSIDDDNLVEPLLTGLLKTSQDANVKFWAILELALFYSINGNDQKAIEFIRQGSDFAKANITNNSYLSDLTEANDIRRMKLLLQRLSNQ